MLISPRSVWSAIAIGALVVGAAGCADAEKKADVPEIGPISVITDPSQVVHPVDAYQLSEAEKAALGKVAAKAFADCIRSYGVDYSPAAEPPRQAGPWDVHPNSFGDYGIFDPSETWHEGFRLRHYPPEVTSPPPPKERDDVDRLASGTTDGFTRLTEFAGKPVPEGGCDKVRSDASSALGVDISPTLETVTPVEDPRLVAAESAWSKCMKQKGFDYPNPAEASRQEKWSDGPSEPVGEEERATARADTQCKLATNLVGIFNAVAIAYEKRWIEANAPLLAEVRARRDDLLRRAAAL
ncbi:hypothetical protein [Yinghuangia soli]|uniref:Lipoprotein n=1 Tax=Yinghuangia soli TaxID=2908204 RepID=A0AA41U1E7_9ACTN|nr:hypothetical protein [Yinghuangia soli]MCF2529546.1 hypothetical protein [Yinghuangia soli]